MLRRASRIGAVRFSSLVSTSSSRSLSRSIPSFAKTTLSAPIRSLSSAATAKANPLAAHDDFIPRHLGPSHDKDINKMLDIIGYSSLDALIEATIPAKLRRPTKLSIGRSKGESEALEELRSIMAKNQIFRSHIGAGYYDTITPPVILRNILENPGWYTPYTPYQAEISQGRLQMLLNYQTMISDLTGLPVSNASLLDEGTAAAEAMNMCISTNKAKKVFLVAEDTHPQTIDVLRTRAAGYNVDIKVVPLSEFSAHLDSAFGALMNYPGTDGRIEVGKYEKIVKELHDKDVRAVVSTDLLALTVLTPPAEWGADIVLGSAQRFGVPMGFGGPHAAFIATSEAYKRKIPGRIIGLSKDSRGKPALRMAMQTREQHIRRDKATSNICTAQALLANTAAAYAVYHGPEGLKRIANKVHAAARVFAAGVQQIGLKVRHATFFDTVRVDVADADKVLAAGWKRQFNVRKLDKNSVAVAFDETSTAQHINELFDAFAEAHGKTHKLDANQLATSIDTSVPESLARRSPFLTHPVFHMYHSETEMLRYLYSLQMKDLSLATAMIPLGSCTMKLNATSEMIPITWPSVARLHPFAPESQTLGYAQMLQQLQKWICDITGFDAVSLQPNAGSQGEYAGLLAIKAYHVKNGNAHRNIVLIPTSAHGTNPASAAMLAFKIVVVSCDEKGNVDVEDLKAKALQHKDNLAALMVTYPSTHGVFEEPIKDITKLIHEYGGQVYMDGANLNAQVGLTSPGSLGADVCHLNLHKTFCIPHGGGGPGMGPIAVAKHLAPFLPAHPFQPSYDSHDVVGAVSAAPFSSASILPISWMYINMMGSDGLALATKTAILNANYMAARLKKYYKILYTGVNNRVAHEFIIDLRELKAESGISEEDIAKRLQDYNFHAPTMSFPVAGTLMIEPTESESLYELDRLVDALINIRGEVQEVIDGRVDKNNNVLKNAPHTADTVISDKWDRPYSREKAAYPLSYLRENKFWPSVGRLDNVYGDRNFICTCPPLETYTN